MPAVSLACPDWEERLKSGRSLIPDLPLQKDRADRAIAVFNKLRLPDVVGQPTFREAGADWFRDIVGALHGGFDAAGDRFIREIFCLVPKKNNKTTGGAGIMMAVLLLNERPRAEFLLIGPTQATAETAFNQAVGMINADPALIKIFHIREHLKEIVNRRTKAKLKIKTFDSKVLTGVKPVGVLIDELHELGKIAGADRVIGQIRGGIIPFPEGFMIFITTQSDERPVGVFASELKAARAVRDGRSESRVLPILYEFPVEMLKNEAWKDPSNWWMVTPNRGLSITIERLADDFKAAAAKGEQEVRRWASQHLNIEIGIALASDSWAGAGFWRQHPRTGASNIDAELTFEEVLRRSDVVVIGIDGGGLDDLLGFAMIGIETGTGNWLLWSRAWAHQIVLERRKEIAPRLLDLAEAGELIMVDSPGDDVEEVADLVSRADRAGLLAEEDAIGVDSYGVADIKKALIARGIEEDRIVGIPQGWQLNGAIKTTERALAGNRLIHAGTALMDFAVGNALVEPRGNAVSIEKQKSGSAKIDPLMACFNAVVLAGRNPQAAGTAEIISI